MLARRFLGCVFVLTLIAVALGFAMFQFGGSVLRRSMTPSGHFSSASANLAPDYARDSAWLARPGLAGDRSGWLPDGVTRQARAAKAALFYVHPTTYLDRDRWNAPFDAGGETAARDAVFVQSQASAFNAVADVWAPRYRQAAFGAFLLKDADAARALDLAYGDVLRAFDAFLAAQPGDRPIILAGHSQGSLHLTRLLRDRRGVLKGRLVAAYVVGWPVSAVADLPAMGLPACSAPDQGGCLLSWQSFSEPANSAIVTDAWGGSKGFDGSPRRVQDMVCVNPISGVANTAAPPAANPGTLLPNAGLSRASLTPGLVGARCEGGFLMVSGMVPPMGPYVLPGNNYHVYDYALFWGAVRADAARRMAAFGAKN